jgi:hypothetical protein
LDCSQAHFSILARHFAIQITLRKISAPRFGRINADWASDLEDRKSTTRFIFIMGGGAISWSSKRQPTIALSTTKAEYMASTQATKEAIWMMKPMQELGYMKEKKAMVIRCH